jgi:hypothetical protein
MPNSFACNFYLLCCHKVTLELGREAECDLIKHPELQLQSGYSENNKNLKDALKRYSDAHFQHVRIPS